MKIKENQMKIEVTKVERTLIVSALMDLIQWSNTPSPIYDLAQRLATAADVTDDGPEVAILRTVRA